MSEIRVFTKSVEPKVYDTGLANSIHFELSDNGKTTLLNRGYGILFPVAKINDNNTIYPRGVVDPKIIEKEDSFLIIGELVNEAGERLSEDKVYAWETKDFVEFTDLGEIERTEAGTDIISIDEKLVPKILNRWIPPFGLNVSHQRKFEYPLVKGFADPVVFTWEGKWYFLATNDINGNVGIYMREADSVDGLFNEGHRLSVILDYDEENEFIQTFWAPEWHIIEGVPYILFAVGGKKWAPQSHIMRYKGTGDIMNPDCWEKPVRVRKQDGSYLSEDGITLDMTYLHTEKQNYVLWSERYNIGTPEDSGSMIYIATVNEKNPAVLTSDKVLLTRPLYGWENVAGTINNEGPYSIIRDGKVIVTYSGGDACGHYYVVGALIADESDNLLEAKNWKKLKTPFFSAYTLNNVDGPGHSSFFEDENGNVMIAFHGQDHGRQSGIHPVYFTKEGLPVLLNEDDLL